MFLFPIVLRKMSRRPRFGVTASSVAGQTMQLVGSEDALTAFQRFYDSGEVGDVLSAFDAVCEGLDLHPGRYPDFFPVLKARLVDKLSYRYTELWKVLEKRAKRSIYGGNKVSQEMRVLVIGAGPCGLRTAIECHLLGARTVVVEETTSFSRNTVLELWKFVVEDLKMLGVKHLFSRLGCGTTDHLSTKLLQTALLKICCLLGVQVYTGVKFQSLLEPEDEQGWHARLVPEDHEARHFSFDVLVGASGLGFCLDGFNRGREEGTDELTLTASFQHGTSPEEVLISELNTLKRSVNSQFYKELDRDVNLKVDNLTYYRDDTHYFQFDVSPENLIKQRILKENFPCRNRLLSKSNIDTEVLKKEVIEICKFATRYHSRQLPHSNLAKNSLGQDDINLVDCSKRYYSKEAGRAIIRKGFPLLLSLVGDTLSNFTWENGLGMARGWLSCLDSAWMVRAWSLQANPLQVLEEREELYKVLTKLKNPTELSKNIKKYQLNPRSRYFLPVSEDEDKQRIISLYQTDNKEEIRYLEEKYLSKGYFANLAYSNLLHRYKSTKPNPGREGGRKIKQSLRRKSFHLKEKILLKLGKTEKSVDPELEDKVSQFKLQNQEVQLLNKSVLNYVKALEAVRSAEADLFHTWSLNIQDWSNLESFLQNTEAIQARRQQNIEVLEKEVVLTLNTYSRQFQEVKGRVDKSEILRISADQDKFHLGKLKAVESTERSIIEDAEKKQKKSEDSYSSVRDELTSLLPNLYGIRREFFATSLYSLFLQQNTLHTDLSYIYREMSEYVLVKLKA
ncbi:F-actin-monooxygenase mical1 isoform X2 [Eurytemora carolleeae]|uniref:F-actin-monooxygenase mical1 isoform X2 n=1 Tax=Eurytemora carolleeae TaxID=1294199 RepID=UPI000C75DD9F|nr:F-actin-monooxygenase mical1 isoform X2 [Eurytemora carolleeae]|eukprot:XP_023323588.1 F-actin-monooxygenase mical1-like isoform X2 [Eurytemora affinis]